MRTRRGARVEHQCGDCPRWEQSRADVGTSVGFGSAARSSSGIGGGQPRYVGSYGIDSASLGGPGGRLRQAGPANGHSNLGHSIGRHGLSAQGEAITSLGAGGGAQTTSGTSAAAPFVTGAIALLLSLFPSATAAGIKAAILRSNGTRRTSVVSPLTAPVFSSQNQPENCPRPLCRNGSQLFPFFLLPFFQLLTAPKS